MFCFSLSAVRPLLQASAAVQAPAMFCLLDDIIFHPAFRPYPTTQPSKITRHSVKPVAHPTVGVLVLHSNVNPADLCW